MTTVMIVEDDTALRRTLAASLSARGYQIVEAGSAEECLALAGHWEPDLVLLDLALPFADGDHALRRLRTFSDMPIVVVTGRDGRADKIAMLDAGADDYIVKPFDDGELLARVRAVLRRRSLPAESRGTIEIGDLEINLEHRFVTRAKRPVHLTANEFRFLRLLVESDGRLLKRKEVTEHLGSSGLEESTSKTLRVYVTRLRKKLGDDAADPKLILTIHGIGYRWIANETDELFESPDPGPAD